MCYHLLCYWPIIHNSSWRYVLKFSLSNFSEVNDLLIRIELENVQTENISTSINVKCYNVLIKGLLSDSQEFLGILSDLDI